MRSLLRTMPLALFGVIALTLGGCNENDPVDPGTSAPNAPTELMANSRSASSIGLKWTAPATGTTPTGYTVMYRPSASTGSYSDTTITGATNTTIVIGGLAEGTKYDFMVHAKNDTVSSTASSTVTWAPAERTVTSLKIYEFESANGSGIELPSTANLKVADGDRWDLAFDTGLDGASEYFDIGPPAATSYIDDVTGKFSNGKTPRVTMISSGFAIGATSLDDVYDSRLLDAITTGNTSINFNDRVNDNKGFVFGVKTQDNHFAKVLVKSVGGVVLQGVSPNRFIELEVSYQNVAGVPYAVKVGQSTPGFTFVNRNVSTVKK